jgi:hypothetical protein
VVIMKNAVFWDMEPCGFIINGRFGGMCRRLHLQGRRNNAIEKRCWAVANRFHCLRANDRYLAVVITLIPQFLVSVNIPQYIFKRSFDE